MLVSVLEFLLIFAQHGKRHLAKWERDARDLLLSADCKQIRHGTFFEQLHVEHRAVRIRSQTQYTMILQNVGIAVAVSYTHLRAHETVLDLVCRLLLEKK